MKKLVVLLVVVFSMTVFGEVKIDYKETLDLSKASSQKTFSALEMTWQKWVEDFNLGGLETTKYYSSDCGFFSGETSIVGSKDITAFLKDFSKIGKIGKITVLFAQQTDVSEFLLSGYYDIDNSTKKIAFFDRWKREKKEYKKSMAFMDETIAVITDETKDTVKEIREMMKTYEKEANKKDVRKYLLPELYYEKSVYYGGEVLFGLESLAKQFEPTMSAPSFTMEIASKRIFFLENEGIAYDIGHYKTEMSSGNTYIFIWKKTEKGWKVRLDS